MSKNLIIGLDGTTLDNIKPWAEQGYLPTLSWIMENGAYGRLTSVMPVLSSAAWSSFMTGTNPGKHSIYDFVRRDKDSYRLRPIRRDKIRVASLWKILSKHGYKVGVINVPITYPPEEVNGFLVSGLGTPNHRPFTYPRELESELTDLKYRVNKRVHYHPDNEEAYLQEVYDITKSHFDASMRLMKSYEWDFFITVFYETDQLAAYFWRHMDPNHPKHDPHKDAPNRNALRDFHVKIDEYIRLLIHEAGQDTNVFIMSDHGAGPFYKDVFLNEWLRMNGYLTLYDDKGNLGVRRRMLAQLGITRQKISSILRNVGMGKVELWIKDRLGDKIEILPQSRRAEFPQAIDWSRTSAYSFGYQGQIYVNLRGREPHGSIEPGDQYNKICEELIRKLSSYRDPDDSDLVVDSLFRREEIFYGPNVDFAPDITLIMRDFTYNTRMGYEFSSQPGTIISPTESFESGSHRSNGILFAIGPDIPSRGYIPTSANILDLVPTILHLFDIGIPGYMDGEPLLNWISCDKEPVILDDMMDPESLVDTSYIDDEKEDEELISILKKLGYLE